MCNCMYIIMQMRQDPMPVATTVLIIIIPVRLLRAKESDPPCICYTIVGVYRESKKKYLITAG